MLGKRLYAQSGDVMVKLNDEASSYADVPPVKALEAWLDKESPASGPCVIVWEPPGMLHERVEAPRVNRKNFARIIAGENDHIAPVIKDEMHGWGFDPINDKKLTRTSMRLHLEGTTEVYSLLSVGGRLESYGFIVKAAFPLATVTLEAARRTTKKKETAGFNIAVFSEGLLNIITTPQGHGFYRHEYEQVDLSEPNAAANLYQVLTQQKLIDTNSQNWLFVGDEQDIIDTEELLGRANESYMQAMRAARVSNSYPMSWDEIADAASVLSPRHCANLYDAFPREFPIDTYLSAAIAVCVLLLLFFAYQWYSNEKSAALLGTRTQRSIAALTEREAKLNANKTAIESLRAEVGIDDSLPKGRADAMAALGDAIPENFILSYLNISETGAIQMTVLQVADGADPVALVTQMQRLGFTNCEAYNSPDAKSAELTGAKKFNIKAQIQTKK
jgi:hypothetical protein